MKSKRSKQTSESTKPAVNAEAEWVVADELEQSAEPRVEREHVDEPELDPDVVQQAPDEVVWAPVEPAAASEAEVAPRVAKKAARATRAKPARAGVKARKPTTNDVTTDATSADDAPAPAAPERKAKRASKRSAAQSGDAAGTSTQGDAGERQGTLVVERAVEVATTPAEPSAAAPLTKKRRLQQFVAERAEQRAAQRAEEPALEGVANPAADRSPESADDAQHPTPAPVAKRKRGKPASEQPATTPPVPEQQPALPSEPAAVAPTNEPSEPVSTLQTMEEYIAELATMSVAQLTKRHVEVLGKQPRIKNKTWLQRKLAWHEQTRRFGGLSGAAKKKLDELMGEIELPVPTSRASEKTPPAPRSADDLPLGTRLERQWRDRVIVATRVEGGWSCEGATYRTLSAAAKAISGTHCSGPAFFGIWKPKGGSAR
jgi:hypothetical protein